MFFGIPNPHSDSASLGQQPINRSKQPNVFDSNLINDELAMEHLRSRPSITDSKCNSKKEKCADAKRAPVAPFTDGEPDRLLQMGLPRDESFRRVVH